MGKESAAKKAKYVLWRQILTKRGGGSQPWEAPLYAALHARFSGLWDRLAKLHAAPSTRSEADLVVTLPEDWFPWEMLGVGARCEPNGTVEAEIEALLTAFRSPVRLRAQCPALGEWAPEDISFDGHALRRMLYEQWANGKYRLRKGEQTMRDHKFAQHRHEQVETQVRALLNHSGFMLAVYRASKDPAAAESPAPATPAHPRPGRPPLPVTSPGGVLLSRDESERGSMEVEVVTLRQELKEAKEGRLRAEEELQATNESARSAGLYSRHQLHGCAQALSNAVDASLGSETAGDLLSVAGEAGDESDRSESARMTMSRARRIWQLGSETLSAALQLSPDGIRQASLHSDSPLHAS